MASAGKIEPIVRQFRYYGSTSDKNEPEGNSWIGLTDDSARTKNLLTDYGSAVKIGIQTLPGIKFFLSNGSFRTGIIIDHTGVYELDLRNTNTTISELYFDVESIYRIDEVDNASLIVDVLYNSKDGTVNS